MPHTIHTSLHTLHKESIHNPKPVIHNLGKFSAHPEWKYTQPVRKENSINIWWFLMNREIQWGRCLHQNRYVKSQWQTGFGGLLCAV